MLPDDLRRKLLAYLIHRPYHEVAALVEALSQLRAVKE
jgi:hypothetical protein